jgi:hypothetical protein
MGCARGFDEGPAHQLIELRVLHATGHRQARQRRHHRPAGVKQQRVVSLVGCTCGAGGVRCEVHTSV